MTLEQQPPSNIIQSGQQPEPNEVGPGSKQQVTVTVPTFGERFPDGAMIERLANGQLVYWDGVRALIQPAVEHGGRLYVAAPLSPELEEALVQPTHIEDHVSTESLLTDLRNEIRTNTGLGESASQLLAIFFMATWVGDCLPEVPSLNVSSSAGGYLIIADLASVFCHRAIRVIESSTTQLAALPAKLSPTLILQQPAGPSLARILKVTSQRYPALLGGEIVRMPAATIVLTTEPIDVATPVLKIELPLTAGSYRRLLPVEARALAERFQPRLLDYRLREYERVANSQFDRPALNPETRILARILGAAMEAASSLHPQLLEALRAYDEQRKVELSQQTAAFVIEALLVAIHENRSAITTGEITELTNAVLLGRGEKQQLSPKKVGSMLRKLKIFAERQAMGYKLALTTALGCQVHDLANTYGVLTLLNPEPLCDCCEQIRTQANVVAQDPASNHHPRFVHDVHHVHDVHESDSEIPEGPPREIDERSLDQSDAPM